MSSVLVARQSRRISSLFTRTNYQVWIISFDSGTPMGTIWREVPGRLKYISCGGYGCWGANRLNHVYFRTDVKASNPLGGKWVRIKDIELTQIEAGPGGIAAGVRPDGTVMVRTGVTRDLPYGDAWKELDTFNTPVKHVSISLDKIYILSNLGDIYESLLEKSPNEKAPAETSKCVCVKKQREKE